MNSRLLNAWCVAIVLCTGSGMYSACATAGSFANKPKPEKAKIVMRAFQASWDEACTQEWLRCDVTTYADTAVDAYVAAVDAHPETWQAAADAAIDKIKVKAMLSDLIGRWVAYLDAAKFVIDAL